MKNWDAYNAINSSSTKLFLSLSSFFSKVSEYFGKIFFNLLNNLCEFSEGDRNMHSLDAPREPLLTLRAQSEAHYAEVLGYVDLKAVEGQGPFRGQSGQPSGTSEKRCPTGSPDDSPEPKRNRK